MVKIGQIVSISDLRSRYNEVLAQLKDGPIVLVQHSRPVAVLVSIQEWEEREAEGTDKQD